ncbi:MAG: orotidine-5'-phosphate decarboxylase [Pseudomonadota bacterium]
MTPKERLIFPLDAPDLAAARALVDVLAGQVGFFKIGLELFIAAGPEGVREIKKISGGRTGLFLDLKLHDIPATVGRAAAAAARLGVDLLTVHGEGGRAMVEAAKRNSGAARVLAITVLTSLDLTEETGLAPEYTNPEKLVLLRAKNAVSAGADGVVCSGREAAAVRKALGDAALIVTPGIRPAWSVVAGEDQKRIVTPARAIRDGADFLVVGRPIRDAPDPAQAALLVVDEIAAAIRDRPDVGARDNLQGIS